MTMDAHLNARRVYIAGQEVEVWENPDMPFRCTQEEIDGYARDEAWILLFNALVLSAAVAQQ
jgi:hypothetical protein